MLLLLYWIDLYVNEYLVLNDSVCYSLPVDSNMCVRFHCISSFLINLTCNYHVITCSVNERMVHFSVCSLIISSTQ